MKVPKIFAGNVAARHGRAHDRVVLRVLQRRRGIDLHRKLLLADQLRIRKLVAAGPRCDHAIPGRQSVLRHLELVRGPLQERLARRGRSPPDLHAAVLYRQAGVGRSLVGRQLGIALDHCYAIE